ncbi:protein NRT1/ PTR FAMILY 2.12-like isoform X1 [Panicum miliaceum]|uniref:Protein NRT1/ PTR FAMILY 2.12-like isoform X1 n=1 Tax=Panicum miliaceum TaxID=4540 RepID=A0A3L6RK02_PANMI|nr:protein NRT1/ PTR FAMILY 2.12-like isoform X1 [Panicum miliaceum]
MAAGEEEGQARQIDRASEPAVAARRRKPQGWKCMPFIIANETFEKAASFGVAANLTTYLVKRFSIGQLQATNITNIFFATLNLTPLLGAFISDSYLGRFKTLAYGCFATLLQPDSPKKKQFSKINPAKSHY